jgi:hypothetical protein
MGDALVTKTWRFVVTEMTGVPVGFTLEKPTGITLDRSSPGRKVVQRQSAIFADHVTATLARQLADVVDESAMLAAATENGDLNRVVLKMNPELRQRLAAQTLGDLDSRMQTLQFTVPLGSRVLAPPYDKEWSVGTAFAFGAVSDGKVTVMAADEPSSAAVGLYLTADQPTEAAITPIGTFGFVCLTAQNLPALRSTGGLGMTVYIDSDEQPAISRQATLWNLNGLSLQTSVSGNGRIADAASPATGLGPVPLAPMIIRMDPGRRYLLWVWGWQVSHQTSDFLGLMNVTMPLVTVDAGPPVIIS